MAQESEPDEGSKMLVWKFKLSQRWGSGSPLFPEKQWRCIKIIWSDMRVGCSSGVSLHIAVQAVKQIWAQFQTSAPNRKHLNLPHSQNELDYWSLCSVQCGLAPAQQLACCGWGWASQSGSLRMGPKHKQASSNQDSITTGGPTSHTHRALLEHPAQEIK